MEFPATLTCSPLFRDIPQEEMASLLSSMDARRRRFARGETVLRRGEPGDRMGLVLSGTVHIVKEDFWGDRTIVGLARSGEVFGEAYACLGGELLEVTVLADADTEANKAMHKTIKLNLNLCIESKFYIPFSRREGEI